MKICGVCTRFVSAQTADGGISDGGGLEESRVGRAREWLRWGWWGARLAATTADRTCCSCTSCALLRRHW